MYDDPLGKLSIDINILKNGEKVDSWFSFADGSPGQIHLLVTFSE